MSARSIALVTLLAGASAAQAVTVFSDNFDADAVGLNKSVFVGGWTVGQGTVDVIGAAPNGGAANAMGYDFLPGNGNYVDLDGSNNDAGVFAKAFSTAAGLTYTVTFSLAGSQRPLGSQVDIVDVAFGSATAVYTTASSDPFSTRSLSFVASTSGVSSLSFSNRGNDFAGALLDNVTISAVPEPSVYGLLLAGMAGVAFTVRRRTPR